MVDEDSHSTDLSVSGEEDHLTILLAYYNFGFNWGEIFLATLPVTPKMLRDLTFVVHFAYRKIPKISPGRLIFFKCPF